MHLLQLHQAFGPKRKYWIEAYIGQGGEGQVYLAQEREKERYVALKVVDSNNRLHDSHLRRAARISKQLHHPAFGQFYNLFSWSGLTCLSSEVLKGETLQTIIDNRRLPLPQALEIALSIAYGLDYLHTAQRSKPSIFHRDLNPQNIMVNFIEGEPVVKIFDLGHAVRVGYDQVSSPSAGTLPYLAPEQIQEKSLDPRVDLYALGLITQTLILGFNPLLASAQNHYHLIKNICEGKSVHLNKGDLFRRYGQARGLYAWNKSGRQVNKLFKALDTFVVKARHRKRSRRFQSARAMAAQLERLSTLARQLEEVDPLAKPSIEIFI